MQKCIDESDIYNYWRIQLSNDKYGILGWGTGVGGGGGEKRLTWLDRKIYHIIILWVVPIKIMFFNLGFKT